MRPTIKITIFGLRLSVVALIIYWFSLFVGTHLPDQTGIIPDVNDKVLHFTAYFGLGCLLCYVTPPSILWHRFSIILLIGIMYAAFDEYTQKFVQGRFPDLADFAADLTGVAFALIAYGAARKALPDKLP